MKKSFIFITIAILLGGIGSCIYFVGNVSATFPPIKEYEYQGNINQLIAKMKLFGSTKSNMVFETDGRLGNSLDGYAYEIIIKVKDQSNDLLYELKFEDIHGSKTKLLIIGAHDLTNNTGGYGAKAVGMKVLLDKFESNILFPLKKEALVIITL